MSTTLVRGTLLGILLALLSVSGLAAAERDVTFTKDVAPILHRSCVNCHKPGSIAPMSLITYDDVRPWARAIKDKISRPDDDPDRMPPWFIEKNVGIQKFKDDPSLTAAEIDTVARWVDSGAVRGDAADMPEIDLEAREWTIGEPDIIVSSPKMTLPAVAPDYYGRIGPSPTGLTADRYVKAVEFREIRHDVDVEISADRTEGDLSYFVVHHAVIMATPGTDAAGGETQTAGASAAEGRGFGGGLFNVVWELGQNSTIYPDSLGVRLPAGSALNFDLHTHSIGTEATFSIDVAFKLHPEGFEPKYTSAGTFGSLTYDLDIPGNQETVVESVYSMARPGLLLNFEPHLHSSGRRMCLEAVYPTGLQETLNCAGYNHNWVKVYHYEDDVAPLLPAGTVLKVTAWYDNTAGNPRVADPRNWKGWGSRSIDDMLFLLSRVIWLTEEEYRAEAKARGIEPVRSAFSRGGSSRSASNLDASEAAGFIGTWTLSLESDRGPFDYSMDIKDVGGKVAATLNSTVLGESMVTDITKDGDDLTLAWDGDMQGQIVPLTLTLTPDGSQLKAAMDFAGFMQMNGVATK